MVFKEEEMERTRYAWLLGASLGIIFFLQAFFGASKISLTWDEPSFISAGYSYLKFHDFSLNPSHPPFMQALEAAPLFFIHINASSADRASCLQTINPVVDYGHKLIFESGNNPREIAFWSRLPVMLLGAALIFAIFWWGRQLYGSRAAFLGAAAATLSPNLIAHAKLATEDLGCTAFVFFSVWSFWISMRRRDNRSLAICGVVTGLALVSKFTAVVLFPIYFALAASLYIKTPHDYPLRFLGRSLAIIFTGASLIVAIVYLGEPWMYVSGMRKIYSDLVARPLYYFMGEVSEKAKWYYCIAAFLMKVPLPTIILICLAGVLVLKDSQHREMASFLLIPAAIIIGVSCFDKANIGLRRILPAFPFLLLSTSQVIASGVSFARYTAYALLVWLAVISWDTYPHHLAYFNSAVGGPERGPYLLDDSNIDWGQDLPLLAEWQQHQPHITPLKLAYSGTAVPEAYGVTAVNIPDSEIIQPPKGIYAISVTTLVSFRKYQHNTGINIDWLSRYHPVERIGNSIYIYEFR
jgi:hypothetical protein